MTVDPGALTGCARRRCPTSSGAAAVGLWCSARADIAWVGPTGFYAKCGATISRVFRTAKLTL